MSTLRLALALVVLGGVLGSDIRQDFKRYKRTAVDNRVRRRCQAQDAYIKRNFDRSDWMYSQRDRLSSVRLVDLKLIGSHNAGSYSIAEPFDEYSVCQNARIQSQLKAGVRYVDLRVGLYAAEPTTRVGHGPHPGAPIADILEEIANFSRAHPKEFFILSIKDADWVKLGPVEKSDLMDAVESAFADVTITSADDWFTLNTTTLGDVWANNRSVLILYSDSLTQSVDNGEGGVTDVTEQEASARGFMSRNLVYDPWANTEDVDTLFQRLNTFYHERPRSKDRFYVAQMLLTATPLLTDPIYQLTAQLQRSGRIAQWLRRHQDYNVAFLDFLLGVSSRERSSSVALLDEIMGIGHHRL